MVCAIFECAFAYFVVFQIPLFDADPHPVCCVPSHLNLACPIYKVEYLWSASNFDGRPNRRACYAWAWVPVYTKTLRRPICFATVCLPKTIWMASNFPKIVSCILNIVVHFLVKLQFLLVTFLVRLTSVRLSQLPYWTRGNFYQVSSLQ